MSESLPESKLRRTAVGGKTAANVSGKVLKYLAKKPFLKKEDQKKAKQTLEKDYAAEIFKGLVMLKGTALKVAQMLSFELDIIPAAIRKELEKSYNQVPPINRALVRKAILNAFSKPPEELFKEFEYEAFAAASLGQVHKAMTFNGEKLAVKVQYPGVGKTIKNDIQMVRTFAAPTPYARFILPVLEEIEKRLMEEIDYEQEAENTTYFQQNLKLKGLVVPSVKPELSNRTTLSTDYLDGLSLDNWIATNPGQEERDHVAALLNEQFMISLFELRCLHADPNPGNFIVMKDGSVGLVDFGCVKRFTPAFIDLYKKISKVMVDSSKEEYFFYLKEMNVLRSKVPPQKEEEIYTIFQKIGKWYGRLYQSELFDFGLNGDFILEGKKMMQETYQFRKYFQPNPEFVFLNRTQYGLFRIFEKLKARVRIQNPQDWD
jgi:predicted unusual protein kinase regulating ubiquinone biosynthesis (AarF/ABC1/UbiB family)